MWESTEKCGDALIVALRFHLPGGAIFQSSGAACKNALVQTVVLHLICEGTVKTHMNHLLRKLGALDRTHAVTLSLKRGLPQPRRLRGARRKRRGLLVGFERMRHEAIHRKLDPRVALLRVRAPGEEKAGSTCDGKGNWPPRDRASDETSAPVGTSDRNLNMKSSATTRLTIEVYSDLICPWCYIGKQRMEGGLKTLGPEVSYKIIWKAFELNPEMSAEGMDRKAYRSAKFGSWERSQAMDRDVSKSGTDAGLDFHFETIERTPHTFFGHRLIWFAGQLGRQDDLNDALLRAYFSEGRDVGDARTLAAIAGENGLDENQVVAFLASEEGAKEVREEERSARERGLAGVPFLIVNGVPAFAGAQLPEQFAKVFRNATAAATDCSGGSCAI